jgi:hypothetical protein
MKLINSRMLWTTIQKNSRLCTRIYLNKLRLKAVNVSRNTRCSRRNSNCGTSQMRSKCVYHSSATLEAKLICLPAFLSGFIPQPTNHISSPQGSGLSYCEDTEAERLWWLVRWMEVILVKISVHDSRLIRNDDPNFLSASDNLNQQLLKCFPTANCSDISFSSKS